MNVFAFSDFFFDIVITAGRVGGYDRCYDLMISVRNSLRYLAGEIL